VLLWSRYFSIIVSLSRYFLYLRNDIFARHLRYASTIDLPTVYSSFSTLQSHAANNVTCVIAARRPRLSSVSVRERCRNCLWSNVSQVVSMAWAIFMTSQLTITSVCLRCGFQVSVLCSVWMENDKSISLCTGLLSVYKTKVRYEN